MSFKQGDRVWFEFRDYGPDDSDSGTVSHVEDIDGDLYAFVVWDDGTPPCWMPAEDLVPEEEAA